MSGEGNANRAVHSAVVDLCATYLRNSELSAVAKPYFRTPGAISSALDGDLVAPDISGVPNVSISVTSRLRHRFGDDLDRARRLADLNGSDVAAFIQWRSGRPVDDAFVILSLRDFSKLVGGSPPMS